MSCLHNLERNDDGTYTHRHRVCEDVVITNETFPNQEIARACFCEIVCTSKQERICKIINPDHV